MQCNVERKAQRERKGERERARMMTGSCHSRPFYLARSQTTFGTVLFLHR